MKIRIKDRRKFSKFISLVITIAVISGCLFATNLASADLECDYQQITIAPGDTLWEIAGRYMSDTATAKAVHKILEYNDKKTSGVFVGEVIRIPLS